MRELDILLQRYLEGCYRAAGDAQKSAFHELLSLSDPELAGYLLKGEVHPESAVRDVVRQILGQDTA